MAERGDSSLKIGQRVEVSSKDVRGSIAFIGFTSFATGKWIGVILDEPKGKNNGSIRGQTYFQCEENHGMFVRPTQLVALDESGNPIQMKNMSPVTSPEEVSKTRGRLSGSRISLASSRQSLTGSRQSLTGSRSHLASPVIEKSTEAEVTSQIPKRAAFVETGFVETLKPQFIPGQSLTSPSVISSSVEDKLTNLQLQQEAENMRAQIRDLNEKVETLKIKRAEDRDKLKDYDKTKMQIEQLMEFKSKIMESQTSLQRDLQKAKLEAREAIEAKDAHAEEMADLAETVEMATLDKEMAEEKAETLQLELEAAKEKIEEMTLDLEILKAEMQEKSGGDGTNGASAYELKQLQQQNIRLRDTLVRMRDLSAHEKHEYQKLHKDLEHKKSEITELGRTKEKLSIRVEELEHQIADLQEQVDAALGAEEMVVFLGEQKMSLEDKVVKLEEEITELEALQDMNEQLVESNAELELDLREEVDLANAAIREALREKEAAFETIADRDQTINKFRDLVQKQQEQCQELHRRLEQESSKPVSVLPEILDFKKMFTETKAYTKAIDLELRRIEVQQSSQHVKYLYAFMPDAFMNRGGDHEAILALLLIPRLICKSEILFTQIRDKFPAVNKIDRNSVIKGHSVEQYAFRTRFSSYIFALETILHQYLYSLNTCSAKSLLKVGETYPEMCAQEKIIDNFVELLKRDQLDENLSMEGIEKCVVYFNTMYPILFAESGLINHNTLLADHVKALNSACDSINTDSAVIKTIIESSDTSDIGLLAQHAITCAESIQQQLKLIKRRIPTDTSITNLGFNKEIYDNLYQCYQHSVKIVKTFQDIVKSATQHIILSGEVDKGIIPDKLKEFALTACEKIYDPDDASPAQCIKNSLAFIQTQITQAAQFLQDNEYDISVTNRNEEKPTPPILVRAQTVKKELEETKNLTNMLSNKEADIKDLRKHLKAKHEELSEMTIRKELAEKKLGNVNKDYEITIETLQRKLEESQNIFKKKEKEFEETLDSLQTDIDSLENERGEMREKLKMYAKKSVLEGISKSISGTRLSEISSTGPSLPVTVRDSPLMLQEIHNLKLALERERNEKVKLQCADLKKKLSGLTPIPVIKKNVDNETNELLKEAITLKKDILMTLATPKVVDLTNRKSAQTSLDKNTPKGHLLSETNRLLSLKIRAHNLQNKVIAETVKRKFGGKVHADFAVFPTKEMSKAINETESINIGEIRCPLKFFKDEKPATHKLELGYADLQKLLQQFVA